MKYKERWAAVRDAQAAWKRAKKANRKLRKKSSGTIQQRNSWKAEKARAMRACPTECEAILFDALRESGFQFHTQVQIGPYIADALIDRGRTVVEVDGPIHDSRKDYDLASDRYMWNQRYRVIRVTNAEVKENPLAVVKKINQFIAEVA